MRSSGKVVRRVASLMACAIMLGGGVGASQAASNNTPLFETTQLFEAGQNGYVTYRIPGIMVTPKGTILVTASGRVNGWGDWSQINVMLRRSTDNGKTWEPARVLESDGKNTVENACMISSGNRLYMTYMENYARCFFTTSDDEGVTWSPPREITPVFETYRTRDKWDWKVIATGPGHGIALQNGSHNGRLIVPIWLATDHSHRPSITSTIYSDDQGATWHAGDVVTQNLPESKNPSENVCIQLADGQVMDNIRCESLTHRRLVAFSPDGATQWTKPQIDEHLFDPVCFASMTRYSLASQGGGRNRILFCNPDCDDADKLGNKANMYVRKNITVRMSYDEGKTWPVAKVVDPGLSGYTDMAVAPDGTIFLAYEHGATNGEKVFSSKYFSVAHFNLAWLTDGADTGD